MFALAYASAGYIDDSFVHLDWLTAHRTSLGALPEKVDRRGRTASVAPLGWTASLVVLAMAAQDAPLPIPPP
jgi:GH15 family glucan-1,4-alpha-glucosidase